jgi:hypothetical protein
VGRNGDVHALLRFLLSRRVRRFVLGQGQVVVAQRRGLPLPAGIEPFPWRRAGIALAIGFVLLTIVSITVVWWASAVLDASLGLAG